MSLGNGPFTHEKKVICVAETAGGAIKVTPVHPHKPIPFTVPKSVIHDDSEVWKKGQEGKLVVQLWFAVKEGWTDGDSYGA